MMESIWHKRAILINEPANLLKEGLYHVCISGAVFEDFEVFENSS